MADRHVRRSGDDYADGFANLLPRGRAWPHDPDSTLMAVVSGLSQIWGAPVDQRAADLLEQETDPRITLEMLEDWERAFGLPDACLDEVLTIADRRKALIARMTTIGAQDRQFFIDLAASIGYEIEISEYSPFMAGISTCGDSRPTDDDAAEYLWQIGPPEIRFYWTVHVHNARLTWFRAGAGEAGVDPHLTIGLATDLECLIRRYGPAHCQPIFDYSGLASNGDLAGTP